MSDDKSNIALFSPTLRCSCQIEEILQEDILSSEVNVASIEGLAHTAARHLRVLETVAWMHFKENI